MPSKRMRSTQPGRAELSPAMLAQLQLGHVPDGTPRRSERFFWVDQLAPAWREFREQILAAWIAARPGSRPWAWWKYDAPAPRTCLDAAVYVYRGPTSDDGAWIWRQGFGLPGCPQTRPPERMIFESQAVYLRRLALLLPGEAARLTVADLAPEVVAIPELAPTGERGAEARPPTAPALASTNGAHRRPR